MGREEDAEEGRGEEVAAASLPKIARAVPPCDSPCIISPDKAGTEEPQLSICGWVYPHLQVGGVAGDALIGRCWGCCRSSLGLALVLACCFGLLVMLGLRMDFSMLLEPLGFVKVLEWVSGAEGVATPVPRPGFAPGWLPWGDVSRWADRPCPRLLVLGVQH